MNTKQLTLIVIGAVIVIGAIISIYIFRKGEPTAPVGLVGNVIHAPLLPGSEIPKEERIIVSGVSGGVSVENFYRGPLEMNDERDALIDRGEDYRLVYLASDGTFLLNIQKLPFEAARQHAEEGLLRTLGIAEEDACRLRVYAAVPRYVDESLAGQIFGLSFCGGGVQSN